MHIAIIGAGISGLMSALELVEQGCTISIFDQQQAGQAASWAGGGILSPMYPWRYVHAVNQLAQFGKASYQAWNQKLYPITGIDFEIHDTGMLILMKKILTLVCPTPSSIKNRCSAVNIYKEMP